MGKRADLALLTLAALLYWAPAMAAQDPTGLATMSVPVAAGEVQEAVDAAAQNLPKGFAFKSAKVTLSTAKATQANGEVDIVVNVGGSITPTDTQSVEFVMTPKAQHLAAQDLHTRLAAAVVEAARQLSAVRDARLQISEFTITVAVKVETVVKLGVTIPVLSMLSIKLGGQRTVDKAGTIALTYSQVQ